MDLWLIILAMGLVTYASRLSFIGLLRGLEPPALARRALALVPPAILAALILPELLRRGDTAAHSFDHARLLAGVLAAFVAWRTHNVLLTIGVGMLALWLARLVLA